MSVRQSIENTAKRLGSFIARQWRERPWRFAAIVLGLALLAVLLAGCGSLPNDLPKTNTIPAGVSADLETAKRAEAAAASGQADAIRNARAVQGFEQTARLFNWAGAILSIVSVVLFAISWFVGPTVAPRRAAFKSLLLGFGMLAASYFLVRYGVASSWLLLVVVAVHVAVTTWPIIEGQLRKSIVRKAYRLGQGGDELEQTAAIGAVQVADPSLKGLLDRHREVLAEKHTAEGVSDEA